MLACPGFFARRRSRFRTETKSRSRQLCRTGSSNRQSCCQFHRPCRSSLRCLINLLSDVHLTHVSSLTCEERPRYMRYATNGSPEHAHRSDDWSAQRRFRSTSGTPTFDVVSWPATSPWPCLSIIIRPGNAHVRVKQLGARAQGASIFDTAQLKRRQRVGPRRAYAKAYETNEASPP